MVVLIKLLIDMNCLIMPIAQSPRKVIGMPDSDKNKELFYASYLCNDNLVRELLATGADPDKYKDNEGDTRSKY